MCHTVNVDNDNVVPVQQFFTVMHLFSYTWQVYLSIDCVQTSQAALFNHYLHLWKKQMWLFIWTCITGTQLQMCRCMCLLIIIKSKLFTFFHQFLSCIWWIFTLEREREFIWIWFIWQFDNIFFRKKAMNRIIWYKNIFNIHRFYHSNPIPELFLLKTLWYLHSKRGPNTHHHNYLILYNTVHWNILNLRETFIHLYPPEGFLIIFKKSKLKRYKLSIK